MAKYLFFLYACLAGAAVCVVGCAHSSPYQKLSCVGSSVTHVQFYIQSPLRQISFAPSKHAVFACQILLYLKLLCVGSSATHGFCIKLLFDVNFAEIIRYVFARAFTVIFPSQRLAWSQNALKTPSL